MAFFDVRNFVRQHAGHFISGTGECQQAAVHDDEAAGHRIGVDAFVVGNVKFELIPRALRQPSAEVVDHFQRRPVHQFEAGLLPLKQLRAEARLLLDRNGLDDPARNTFVRQQQGKQQ